MKKSEINFSVILDDQKMPETIHWKAEDSGMEGEKECSSAMISIWDSKEKCTLRIDLWTKQMMVEEMQHLFYETFRSMADTYRRSTNDDKAAAEITSFAERFGKMAGVIK